ncbi:2-amino-4-hydroxy-6-hydroxymethyldihydropteridine diphosphokinase [Corynebacterium durum]|jgi:2-amino-4-hydroxy-6-hydroxymethyldihydropteridine diphosphokinase
MRAVLSIGSNMNDRRALLQGAYDHFRPELVAASHIYATPPWGVTDQEDFLNAILIVETSLSPMELLRAGQALERAAHRVHTRKWGARTLDVDLICCADDAGNSIESSDPTLTLPHPWAAERVFVLVPWLDADSQATLNGVHVTELLAALDPADVEAVRVVGSFAERGLE